MTMPNPLTNLTVTRAADMLDALIQSSGYSYNQIADFAGMDTAYLHRVCKGKQMGTRDAVLRICIAARLGVDEIDLALNSRGYAELGGKRREKPEPLPADQQGDNRHGRAAP